MIKLQKVHGSSNNFFILDIEQLKNPPTDEQLITLTRHITQDFWGGSDGLLIVSDSQYQDCLGKMRVINSDGSEASMCGNGLRTVARYLAEKHNQNEFKVETLKANLLVKQQPNLAPNVFAYGVEISPVYFEKSKFPFDNLGYNEIKNTKLPQLSDDLNFYAIAVPNPHLISLVDDEKDLNDTLEQLGQKLNQTNPYFSDGVNVNFAKILGKNKLFVRTFERGVGFTNACGTGMSATSLAYVLNQNIDSFPSNEITVYNPGGVVKTIVHKDDDQFWIELIGNATITHTIDISENNLLNNNFNQATINETDEQADYLSFINQIKKQAD